MVAGGARKKLYDLIDGLVRVDHGANPAPGMTRPILIVEGMGGSGRSTVLREAWDRYGEAEPRSHIGLAPRARLEARSPGVTDLRSILNLITTGLSSPAFGYDVAFHRFVLANITMRGPLIDNGTPEEDAREMAAHLKNRKGQDQEKRALLSDILTVAAGVLMQGVNIGNLAGNLVNLLGNSSWLTRRKWDELLRWFDHQNLGLQGSGIDGLVVLNQQHHLGDDNNDENIRNAIDQLLLNALLADLQASIGGAQNRPNNALVLIDDGDTDAVVAFVKELISVRNKRAADRLPPDPLTVVIGSSGELSTALAGGVRRDVKAIPESEITGSTRQDMRGESCLTVTLGDLDFEQVEWMCQPVTWRDGHTSKSMAKAIYRITSGHVAGSSLVKRTLEDSPALIRDPKRLLDHRSPGEEPLSEEILAVMVAPLTSEGVDDEDTSNALITLSAARDRAEAEKLSKKIGVGRDLVLKDSPALWLSRGAPGDERLHPLFRFLLLRKLAARPESDEDSWQNVFTALAECAHESEDEGGVLHAHLALGGFGEVEDRLIEVLKSDTPMDDWLRLLDAAVATPHLVGDLPQAPRGDGSEVGRLVRSTLTLADLERLDQDEIQGHHSALCQSYEHLVGIDASSAEVRMRMNRHENLAKGL